MPWLFGGWCYPGKKFSSLWSQLHRNLSLLYDTIRWTDYSHCAQSFLSSKLIWITLYGSLSHPWDWRGKVIHVVLQEFLCINLATGSWCPWMWCPSYLPLVIRWEERNRPSHHLTRLITTAYVSSPLQPRNTWWIFQSWWNRIFECYI